MYYLITIINVIGAVYVMALLIDFASKFVMAKYMEWYVFFSIVGMLYLSLSQMYHLTMEPTGMAKLRISATLWWLPKVFLLLHLRTTSLRRNAGGKDIKFTNIKSDMK